LNIATTRAFKSGDSQAIIIPAELAYDDMSVELSITRDGDVIVVAPARPSMKDLVADLRAVPKPSSIEVRMTMTSNTSTTSPSCAASPVTMASMYSWIFTRTYGVE